MDVTSGITNVLIHVGEEGDHVVAHLGFDFEDALHLEAGLRLDGVESLLGHATEPAVGFGGSDLHIKPALEFRLLTPDGSHLRKGVTLNHRRARLNNPQIYGAASARLALSAGPQCIALLSGSDLSWNPPLNVQC